MKPLSKLQITVFSFLSQLHYSGWKYDRQYAKMIFPKKGESALLQNTLPQRGITPHLLLLCRLVDLLPSVRTGQSRTVFLKIHKTAKCIFCLGNISKMPVYGNELSLIIHVIANLFKLTVSMNAKDSARKIFSCQIHFLVFSNFLIQLLIGFERKLIY